jgi:hypothetical protein
MQEAQLNPQQSDARARLQHAQFDAKKIKTPPSSRAARYSNSPISYRPDPAPQSPNQTQDDEQETQEDTPNNATALNLDKQYALQFALGTALTIKTAIARKDAQEDEEEQQDSAQEAESKENEKKRRVLKAGARRGGMLVANYIAGALDGTGIGFLVGFFVHLFSIFELLLEKIYGRHMAKGKSKIIPPLSWEPIPLMPQIDPNAVILQGIIITCAIGLGLTAILLGAGGLCFMHDLVKFADSPFALITNVAGGGEGMCLGGIIQYIFGL